MKLRAFHLVPVIGLLVGGVALIAPSDVEAQSTEDCSKLKKWDGTTTFKDKDIVWAVNNNSSSDGSKYQCIKSTCRMDPPAKKSYDWKLLANCKSGTKPK